MLARILNNGHRAVYPTCIGDLRIPKGQYYELHDKKAIEELQEYPDLMVEVLEKDATITALNFSLYPVNHLRNMASKIGIERTFFMKKVDLIKLLEEQYESTI